MKKLLLVLMLSLSTVCLSKSTSVTEISPAILYVSESDSYDNSDIIDACHYSGSTKDFSNIISNLIKEGKRVRILIAMRDSMFPSRVHVVYYVYKKPDKKLSLIPRGE